MYPSSRVYMYVSNFKFVSSQQNILQEIFEQARFFEQIKVFPKHVQSSCNGYLATSISLHFVSESDVTRAEGCKISKTDLFKDRTLAASIKAREMMYTNMTYT